MSHVDTGWGGQACKAGVISISINQKGVELTDHENG